MKHNRRHRRGKPRTSPSVLERINPNVAGIDCGSAEHFVAVPPDRDPCPVQCFSTFTCDLVRLADWLIACGVTSVAMEATGVYWIPVYDILEGRGLAVLLVNARHIKNVPGRKSDVSDCEWLRELHSVGLLRGSFRPSAAIVALRTYLRHRQTLIESASTYIQRMQKALVQMNLQLPLVVTDITGVTGMLILRAIVAGQRDPQRLAAYRDRRCHASTAEIVAALTGHYQADHLFVLQQNLELYDTCQQQIAACDRAIEAHVQTLTATVEPPATPLPPPRARTGLKNEPAFEIRAPLHQLTGGVDLSQIEGIAPYLGAQITVRNRHGHVAVAHRETLHGLAHARAQKPDLWRSTAQLQDPVVRQSRRSDPAHGRDEPRQDADRPRCLLPPLGPADRQTASHYRDRPQTRHPGLSRTQGGTRLSGSRRRRVQRPTAYPYRAQPPSARRQPRV